MSAISMYFLNSSYDLCTVGRVTMEKQVSAIGNFSSPSLNLTRNVAPRGGKWLDAVQKQHKSVNVGLSIYAEKQYSTVIVHI